jgi:tRNA (guanine-N7-)-methyltransferase
MSKGKLVKFAQVAAMPNMVQNHAGHNSDFVINHKGEEVKIKGKWHEFFGNDKPITLELACGGGEYTVALAARYPDRNFIGVDIKSARMLRGAKQAIREGNTNAAFLRTRIEELLCFFAENEVAEIWITFPDPFLRHSDRFHRLTSHRFQRIYQQIIQKNGIIHLKTDEPNLFDYTLAVLAEINANIQYQDRDIHSKPLPFPELAIKTYFESIDIAQESTVKYVQYTLPETEVIVPVKKGLGFREEVLGE